jgi:hypothetical protein
MEKPQFLCYWHLFDKNMMPFKQKKEADLYYTEDTHDIWIISNRVHTRKKKNNVDVDA